MTYEEPPQPDETGLPVQLSLELSGGPLALPRRLDPMLAQATAQPFDSPDYLFEVRWDSVRAVATIEDNRVTLHNRRLGEVQAHFPELTRMPDCLSETPVVLDGEIIIVDEVGRPDFDALQRRLRSVGSPAPTVSAGERTACYLAYDLLFRGNRWLTSEPLIRRKRTLAEIIKPSECVYVSEYFDSEGIALFDAVAESDLEGIVAKSKGGAYTPGSRANHWLAVKRSQRAEFVIGGYSVQISGGARSTQLLLGAYDLNGNLTYVGSSTAPTDDEQRTELFATLNALQVDQSPFHEPPRFVATWVRPDVVVTIHFGRWELGQPLRFPTFERIRFDVSPDECLLPLAPTPEGSTDQHVPRKRPHLTMLTTLPLPLPGQPMPRPNLRIVSEEP